MEDYTATGHVYFFNSENKKLISQLSLSEPDNKIEAAMVSAIKDVK